MNVVSAAIVLAVALGAGEGRAKGEPAAPRGADATNAARAKMGLLPRKAPRATRAPAARRARVLGPTTHEPTYLGEPGVPVSPEHGVSAPEPPAGRSRPAELGAEVRVAAAGVVTDVAIVLRYDR